VDLGGSLGSGIGVDLGGYLGPRNGSLISLVAGRYGSPPSGYTSRIVLLDGRGCLAAW
jgi:hypothetical protein